MSIFRKTDYIEHETIALTNPAYILNLCSVHQPSSSDESDDQRKESSPSPPSSPRASAKKDMKN